MKKIISVFLICLTLLAMLSTAGCGSKNTVSVKAYDSEHEKKSHEGYVAAQNDNWSLEWDQESFRVILRDKKNGDVYSNLPSELMETVVDEDGIEKRNNPQLENPLTVEYLDNKTLQIQYLYAYTASLKKGDYFFEEIENGFKITYYFEKISASVPISYRLEDDGINVSVDLNEITESCEKIYRITLMPFFASAKNEDQSSYLFVPSGSGALIYPYEWISDSSKSCSYPVYGDDLQYAQADGDETTNREPVRLPVFGSKNGDSAVCAVIDSGAELASIECNVGNSKFGYSTVYASFNVRGLSSWDSYSDDICDSTVSVSYYPLSGESANYVGIADKYRDYLIKDGIKSGSDEKLLSLKIIGGTHTDEQFLGVPYRSLFTTTSLSDALEIIKDISEKTNEAPAVNLVGFGKSGIDVGKVSGNNAISNKFGDKTDCADLQNYCAEKNIPLYFDFDNTRFAKSGNGIIKLFDFAKTTVGTRAVSYRTELGSNGGEIIKEYFVPRSKLVSISEKSVDSAQKLGFNGVSFNVASSNVYSDYATRSTFCSGNYGKDFNEITDYCKNNRISFLADNANAYSVKNADILTSVPTSSDKNDLFSEDIPFYQIVFKGYVSMTSDPLNNCTDSNETILKSAESGIGLSYTLIKNFDETLITANQYFYNTSVYDDLSEEIEKNVADYGDYFNSVTGAKIIGHEILGDGLRKTVFDNGVTVFVNYSSYDVESTFGRVAAKSFMYSKEEAQ